MVKVVTWGQLVVKSSEGSRGQMSLGGSTAFGRSVLAVFFTGRVSSTTLVESPHVDFHPQVRSPFLKASSSLKNDRVFQGIRRTLRIDGLGVSWVIESWSRTGSEVVWSSNDLDLERTIAKDDSGSKTWEHHVGPRGPQICCQNRSSCSVRRDLGVRGHSGGREI